MGSEKGKPATVDDAVVLANEMQSYLNIHGQHFDTVPVASVNNLAGPSFSRTEMFSDLVFTIKEESNESLMTETVPRAAVAGQSAPLTIAPTIPMAITETTKDATTMGTEDNASGTKAVIALQAEIIHKTARRRFAIIVQGKDLHASKSLIIVIEKIIRQKIARPDSNAAEWNIFGANAAAGPSR